MIIACEKCETKYNIDENVTSESAFKVRCYRCSHLFTAFKSPPDEIPLLLENEVNPDRDRVIAISNQKGGVAKTSTCINLGISLSLLKKRVLMIDFDVQSNLTLLLGYNETKSFYEILDSGTEDLSGIIRKTRYPNLWLLPSNSRMALLTKKYLLENNFEHFLRDRLDLIKDDYDHILIDTPPSIEFFTLNALAASNFAIIPSQCEYLSIQGVRKIEEIIKIINQKDDHDIDYKVLITMYDPNNTSSKVIYSKIQKRYKDKTFNTVIEHDTKMPESQIVKIPVILYDKKSKSAFQYIKLAKEILGE